MTRHPSLHWHMQSVPACTAPCHVPPTPNPDSPPCSYATVAVSGYTLFGSAIDGDVLKDLTARFVATLVPRTVAHAVVYGVALSCEPLPGHGRGSGPPPGPCLRREGRAGHAWHCPDDSADRAVPHTTRRHRCAPPAHSLFPTPPCLPADTLCLLANFVLKVNHARAGWLLSACAGLRQRRRRVCRAWAAWEC